MTRYGWRVVIPNDHEGGPWETGDELEVVTRSGDVQWVTLLRLAFTGSDKRRSQWWVFVSGKQSSVALHEMEARPPDIAPPEDKSADWLLDEDDEERVTTGAGAAYLGARKRAQL